MSLMKYYYSFRIRAFMWNFQTHIIEQTKFMGSL